MAISLQDIFNAAWQHFVVLQNPPAVDGGSCSYKMEDGKKCAVGLVLPEGHVAQGRYCPLSSLVREFPELWAPFMQALSNESLDIFQKLLHDANCQMSASAQRWRVGVHLESVYRTVAQLYNLSVPSMEHQV